MRLGFDGMDQIGELHGISDKEHRYIIAHQIIVSLLGIEFYSKTSYILTVSAEPLPPATVENLTKTGVCLEGSCRNLALV